MKIELLDSIDPKPNAGEQEQSILLSCRSEVGSESSPLLSFSPLGESSGEGSGSGTGPPRRLAAPPRRLFCCRERHFVEELVDVLLPRFRALVSYTEQSVPPGV